VRGIDVSHHQGAIDWPRVRASGVEFAFIKATEGGDFVDSDFAANWNAAGAAGVARGAYHYFTLCTPGAQQAANFLRAVPTGGELPSVADLEYGGNCATRPGVDAFATELTAFLKAVADRHGRPPVLYTTYDFLGDYLAGRFADSGLWIRDVIWRPGRPGGRPWLFWQHHDRGSVPGIDGPVDLNVFAGDREAFAALLAPPGVPAPGGGRVRGD
jgi:lysozyme